MRFAAKAILRSGAGKKKGGARQLPDAFPSAKSVQTPHDHANARYVETVHRSSDTDNLVRLLARLRRKMARPDFVAIRVRNPWTFLRRRREG